MSIHNWMENLSSSKDDGDEESGIHSAASHPSPTWVSSQKFKIPVTIPSLWQWKLDENLASYNQAGKSEVDV